MKQSMRLSRGVQNDMFFDVVTNVMKAHCGQEGGLPIIDWYRLRSELVSELKKMEVSNG